MLSYYQDRDEAIKLLMDKYGEEILRIAYLFIADKNLCDVFQEVFIKAYKKLSGFKNRSSIKTWLFRITINQCKDMLKSSWYKKEHENVDYSIFSNNKSIDDSNMVEDILFSEFEHKKLYNCIDELSVPLKEVIILKYYNDLNENEISKALNIPLGTVRSRMHRAKNSMKIIIEREE